jgi:hypothetical protein
MKKVRRRLVEERVREFRDAAEYVTDHPLLLWSPGVGEKAQALLKEVAKAQRRSRAWSSLTSSDGREH